MLKDNVYFLAMANIFDDSVMKRRWCYIFFFIYDDCVEIAKKEDDALEHYSRRSRIKITELCRIKLYSKQRVGDYAQT
jgi:hypothetical protein